MVALSDLRSTLRVAAWAGRELAERKQAARARNPNQVSLFSVGGKAGHLAG